MGKLKFKSDFLNFLMNSFFINFFMIFLYIYIYIYIFFIHTKMSKTLSAEYNQENKQRLLFWKERYQNHERHQNHSKEGKEKTP